MGGLFLSGLAGALCRLLCELACHHVLQAADDVGALGPLTVV